MSGIGIHRGVLIQFRVDVDITPSTYICTHADTFVLYTCAHMRTYMYAEVHAHILRAISVSVSVSTFIYTSIHIAMSICMSVYM